MAADRQPSLGEPSVPFSDKRRGGLPEPVILMCAFQNQSRQDVTNRARKQERINSKDASSHVGTVGTPGLQKARPKLFPAGKGSLCYSRSAEQPRWLADK